MAKKPRKAKVTVGDVYSFRTTPFNEFSEADTGRYAALKILNLVPEQKLFNITLFDGIWPRPPTLDEIRSCSVLNAESFNGPVVMGVPVQWSCDLQEFTLVTNEPLTADQQGLVDELSSDPLGLGWRSMGTWTTFDNSAEYAWRQRHDAERFAQDLERGRAAEEAKRLAVKKRYEMRLKTLTWDILLAETPFKRWVKSPPFPPATFTAAAREKAHETCRALQVLGPRPAKRDVRAVLQELIAWFNIEDERAGYVLETEEREDIWIFFEEAAFVARHPKVAEEVYQFRTW